MNILITGSTSGIGFQVLNELKKNKKNNFFLISRKNKKYKKKNNINYYNVNLNNLSSLNNKLNQIKKDSKNKIDLIICCAAESTFGNLEKIRFNDYKKNMNVIFFSHLMIIKKILPLMQKYKYGHIVNISSGAGIVGLEKSSNYSVGKSSMQILIESISKELKKQNIFAKNIFPGPTRTSFFKKNIYIGFKPKIIGKSTESISKIIVKKLFEKKINIFCQKKTMAAYIIKMFPDIF